NFGVSADALRTKLKVRAKGVQATGGAAAERGKCDVASAVDGMISSVEVRGGVDLGKTFFLANFGVKLVLQIYSDIKRS
ncbi:MAG: hypothetical protein K2H47_06625, partial [Muribaculaceae bacterium]|nr:hypothetical protein [Muribaculaceae bacterium]